MITIQDISHFKVTKVYKYCTSKVEDESDVDQFPFSASKVIKFPSSFKTGNPLPARTIPTPYYCKVK